MAAAPARLLSAPRSSVLRRRRRAAAQPCSDRRRLHTYLQNSQLAARAVQPCPTTPVSPRAVAAPRAAVDSARVQNRSNARRHRGSGAAAAH
eukprot:366217-Chlamydomonas_euryale.AAC.22